MENHRKLTRKLILSNNKQEQNNPENFQLNDFKKNFKLKSMVFLDDYYNKDIEKNTNMIKEYANELNKGKKLNHIRE